MEAKTISELARTNIKIIDEKLDLLEEKTNPDLNDLFDKAALEIKRLLVTKPSSAIRTIAADNGDLFDEEVQELAKKRRQEKADAKGKKLSGK